MLFVTDAGTELNTRALAAKTDEAAFEALVRGQRRFILGCAFKTAHRFISESDDAYSVALIAFHEAVQTYDSDRGDFKPFAALVIRRRLLDHLQSESRRAREISADIVGGELAAGEEAAPLTLEIRRRVSEDSMESAASANAMRDEIEAAQQLLSGYGFSFFDLADCSPKAKKTKAACAAVIRELLADAELMRSMRASGTLPAKKLCERTGVPRKIPENHRKYIIAAAELLDGDFPLLAEYLRFIRKGDEQG